LRDVSPEELRDRRVDGAAAAGLRLSDAGTFPVDLDCLALDAQLRSVEQHVASPKGENLPQAGVRPEGPS
jgi:hypothetical protein